MLKRETVRSIILLSMIVYSILLAPKSVLANGLSSITLRTSQNNEIFGFSSQSSIAYSPYTISGKWAIPESGSDSTGRFKFASNNIDTDWQKYNCINLRIYSEKATGSDVNLIIGIAEEMIPGKESYFYTMFNVDWEGEWKVITLPLSSFKIGWDANSWGNMKELYFTGSGWDAKKVNGTVLYFDEIWLSPPDVSISEITQANDTYTLNINVANQKEAGPLEGVAVVALFDADKNIVAVKEKEFIAAEKAITQIPVDITATDAVTAKVFIWDSLTNTQPYYKNITVRIATTFSSADFTEVKDRWRYNLSGNNENDMIDFDFAKKVITIDDQGDVLWKSMKKGNGIPDLWLSSHAVTTGDMTSLYNKIYKMALAYATYGTKLYQSNLLKDDIIYALDWMYNNIYGKNEIAGTGWKSTSDFNWWDWQVGAPTHLVNILMLMEKDLDSKQISKYLEPVNYLVPKVNSVGANRMYIGYVVLGAALLEQNGERVVNAVDSLDELFEYSTAGEGFYEDGSYVFHLRGAMNGVYGTEHLKITSIVSLFSGTKFGTISSDINNCVEWIYNAFEPFVYKGNMMDMVKGRVPEYTTGIDVIKGALHLLGHVNEGDRRRLKSMIKYHMLNGTNANLYSGLSIGEISGIKAILNDDSIIPREKYFLNKIFYNMDRVVHQREDFAVGISMSSSRIYNYESINNQNMTGWYTGDGMLYMYNNNLTQFDKSYWQNVNPYRMAGTTVDTQKRQAVSVPFGGEYLSSKDFVGGASLYNLYGAAAMWLESYRNLNGEGGDGPLHNSTLEAKKSWFMFDDEVVALGADIKSNDGFTVETIVDNRKSTKTAENLGQNPHYTIKNIMASAVPEAENIPENTVDNNFGTRWSAEGEVWIEFDLGDVVELGYVGAAFYLGDRRKAVFDLEISADRVHWDRIYSGQSSGTTNQLEAYDLKNCRGRYVRLLGHGNTDSLWNSITEIRIYPPSPDQSFILDDELHTVAEKLVIDNNDVVINSIPTVFEKTNWVNLEGTGGYYFPEQPSVNMRKTNTNPDFFEMWLDHGKSPQNKTYSYVLLPNKTPDDTKKYADNPDTAVLSNTGRLQAVRENTLGITAVVFWERGTFEEIEVSEPLIVMVWQQENKYTVSLSDPTQKLQKATLKIHKAVTPVKCDSGVEIQKSTGNVTELKVVLAGSRGKTYTMEFSLN